MRKILIPIDFSINCYNAFRYGMRLAEITGREVLVMVNDTKEARQKTIHETLTQDEGRTANRYPAYRAGRFVGQYDRHLRSFPESLVLQRLMRIFS